MIRDGFFRVAAVSPKIRVADCSYNARSIGAAAKEAAQKGANAAVFPELCLTGYTCGDLFLSETLLKGAETALKQLIEDTADMPLLCAVGVPVPAGQKAILKLRPATMKLVPQVVGRSLALGVTGFTMSFTNSLVSMVYNRSLIAFGGYVYVTAMTIINSIREFIFTPVSGISGGAQPVLGFNYGAARYDRVRDGIKSVTWLLFAVSTPVWVLLMLFPESFIRVFNDDPELIAVGSRAIRLFYMVYFAQTFQSVGQCVFTGLGMTKYAIFFSILRKVVIVIPAALILPNLFSLGVDGIFLSEPVSEILGSVSCFCTMVAVVVPRLKRLEAEAWNKK